MAVGGDGTVNEVGRELINKSVHLGIIPTGSGNGLSRHLRLPMNSKRALKRILKRRYRTIDTAKIDNHIFLNVAGIGFDARVSEAFSTSTRRGWYNYLRIIVNMLLTQQSFTAKISSVERNETAEWIMISLANSAQYGNHAKIAPRADIADGKLDVCTLRPIGAVRSIFFLILLMTGFLRNSKYFNTFTTSKLKISGTDGLAHVDGEPISTGKEIEVEILAASLKVIC